MATSVRATTLRIRFSDIIVKSKKVVEESGKDAVMKMSREKLRKEREEEKAMMEERAMRQRLRQEQRLALEKMAEEAKSDFQFQNHHLATMEIVSLCGGSRMARSRWWMKQLGLVLKTTDDDDCDDDFYLEKAPRHRHGHDDYDLEEVIMQAFKEALQDTCQVYISVYSFILQTGKGKLITLSHSRAAL